jgi:hypothetical protein
MRSDQVPRRNATQYFPEVKKLKSKRRMFKLCDNWTYSCCGAKSNWLADKRPLVAQSGRSSANCV